MNILLTADELRAGVDRLARQVERDFAGRQLSVVGVLTGSVVFLADVIRRIDLPLQVGLIGARSYRGAATRPGALTVHADLMPDLRGRDVLIVDDIFDTGRTLECLYGTLAEQLPASIHSAVLLRKSARAEVDLVPDYVAFEIPDQFVVGYGLDYQDAYRNLPYVAALDECELTSHGAAAAQHKPAGPVA